MRLIQFLREIFYFPFYFVSLNMAGFLSFVRFIQGSQPPMWKKGDRVSQILCAAKEDPDSDYEGSYEDDGMDYPQASSGGMR